MDIYKISEILAPSEIVAGFHRITPVWGNTLSAKEFFSFILPQYQGDSRLLSPPEVGATLSHIQALTCIARTGRPGIILESDTTLSHSGLDTFRRFHAMGNVNFALLAISPDLVMRIRRDRLGRALAFPKRWLWGAQAYFVSAEVADDLLAFQASTLTLADAWPSFLMRYPWPLFVCPVTTHTGQPSTIQEGRRAARRPLSTWDRFRQRLEWDPRMPWNWLDYSRYREIMTARSSQSEASRWEARSPQDPSA